MDRCDGQTAEQGPGEEGNVGERRLDVDDLGKWYRSLKHALRDQREIGFIDVQDTEDESSAA